MMSSESLDEKLIEAVREFTCIWQVNSKAYKDKVARENAWKIIANQVCCGVLSLERYCHILFV